MSELERRTQGGGVLVPIHGKTWQFASLLSLLAVFLCDTSRAQSWIPQTPVAAATFVAISALGWGGLVNIEVVGDDEALLRRTAIGKHSLKSDDYSIVKVDDCKFQLKGGNFTLNFGSLTTEYSYRPTVRGSTEFDFTVFGTGREPITCSGTRGCDNNLEISSVPREWGNRVLRAVDFISRTSCPAQRLPF